ncbi:hypothetical protein [Laceyella putida]|uniref:Uncharacterized protein n=1 Tax=Laceyella putida TaxID=110101 RepID=A0ABW2RKG4_9BACL
MKTNAGKAHRKSLTHIDLHRHWPSLDAHTLYSLELEQDEYYQHIPAAALPQYVEQAMAKGKKVATTHGRLYSLQKLLNLLLKEGVCVRFRDKHPLDPTIRAQYNKKTKTIEIYRNSLQQITHFFNMMDKAVADEEIILLHLIHEWFHHLEETRCGRTDADLPKVVIKQVGPLKQRKSILRTREIGAHAFTQAVMQLSWSPLLLDYLLDYQQQGWTKAQIREHFHRLKQRFEPNPYPQSSEENDTINNN